MRRQRATVMPVRARLPFGRDCGMLRTMSSAASSASRSHAAPALHVDDLGKQFGERVAFEGVSFEIGYGEVFGFLGPNGAGKTTTVRTLGTLMAPTSGSASVAGFALTPENGV